MKFKSIKPGSRIHCRTEEEATALLKHLNDLGYKWNTGESLLDKNSHHVFGENTYYHPTIGNRFVVYGEVGPEISDEMLEFTDLVEQDEKTVSERMTATEIINWLQVYEKETVVDDIFGGYYCVSDILRDFYAQDIVDKIDAYEALKKKRKEEPKPVKLEWITVCRIIERDKFGDVVDIHDEPIVTGVCGDVEDVLRKYLSETNDIDRDTSYTAERAVICRPKEGRSCIDG